MQKYESALKALKAICYLLLCAVGGFILGDEFSDRLERSNFRSACYAEMVSRMGQEPNEAQDLYIRFQCRSNIP